MFIQKEFKNGWFKISCGIIPKDHVFAKTIELFPRMSLAFRNSTTGFGKIELLMAFITFYILIEVHWIKLKRAKKTET
jgi:hypothetical protein